MNYTTSKELNERFVTTRAILAKFKYFRGRELLLKKDTNNYDRMKNIEPRLKSAIFAILLLSGVSVVILANINPLQLANAQNATAGNNITTSGNITNSSSTISNVTNTGTLGDVIPNEWIVTFRDNVTANPSALESTVGALSDPSSGVEVTSTLPEIGVVAIKIPPGSATALADVQDDPNILAIEPNRIVEAFGQTVPTGINRTDAEPAVASPITPTTVIKPVNATIAIIDTGIDANHPDLNVVRSVSFVPNGSLEDKCGHGTHVAGIAAAKNNNIGVVGVAPGAKLVSVKVLEKNVLGRCTGSDVSVLGGINYVMAHANETDVANLSLGGTKSIAENTAVARAVASGVTMVVAAGNSDEDASNFSPASEPTAITVSAVADTNGKCGGLGPSVDLRDAHDPSKMITNTDDSFASYSNFGELVDIAAPGTKINSTVPLSRNPQGYDATFSGTSMAAPHVAGAAALYKSVNHSARPSQVLDALLAIASTPLPIGGVALCDGHGHGYILNQSYDKDPIREPLLYVKGLIPPSH